MAAAHYSNSSLSQCNITGNEQWAPYILHVDPNKTYRIRIASTTALASLNLAIGVSLLLWQQNFDSPSRLHELGLAPLALLLASW